jgi:hypothetical protein
MSIPAVTLDDLTWTDLTAAARRRIPAASKGRWTLHAPVDPGVTLLELHAWLLEQRLYWMDQVPDAMTRGALALLGESARDAQCAATVFQFTAPQPGSVPAGTQMTLADSDPPLIFTTDTDLMVLPFARDIRNGVEGPPLIGLRLGRGTDRATDLMAGREVCLFEQPGVDVEITLRLTQAILPANLAEITLLFLLGSDTVAPQWSADAADVPPPASLSWWYASAPSGARKRFAQVSDGTGGLRRSGIVRFALPGDWYAPAPGGDGIRSYSLWVRAETAAFTAPPRLAGLAPNALIARHRRRWLQLRPDIDWLPLPNNSIPLGTEALPPLTDRASLRIRERDDRWHKWRPTADLAFHGREDRVFLIDRDAGTLTFGNGETGRIPVLGWSFGVRDLADPLALALAWQNATDPVSNSLWLRLPPQQRAIIAAASSSSRPSVSLLRTLCAGLNRVLGDPAFYDAQRFAAVTLRDATRALIGPAHSKQGRRRANRMLLEDAYPKALARYAVRLDLDLGGGTAGNVGALRDWEPTLTPVLSGLEAVNVVDAIGGAEREPLADARQRAASDLRRIERAVIADDYVVLACTTPGVAIRRAHVAAGVTAGFPCATVPGAVTVFIVPDAPRDDKACPIVVAPEPDAGALAAVTARLDATRLLGTELYVRAPIYCDIAVTIDVEADTDASDAMRADVAAWLGRFLDPLVGGDQQTGWPFGGPLTPSVLLRRAQDVIGDRGEVVRVGIRRLGTDAEDKNCNDVDIGPNALPALRQVTTRVTASRATIGGLQ